MKNLELKNSLIELNYAPDFFNNISNIFPKSKNKIIHDVEKFWRSSKNDSTTPDLSHGRGKSCWTYDSFWQEMGQHHISLFKKLCGLSEIHQINGIVERETGRDGENLIVFQKEIPTIFEFDISSLSLVECELQLKQSVCLSFKKVLIPTDNPEACFNAIESPIVFFLSTEVCQQFPSKEHGIKNIPIVFKILADRCIALIQIPYENGTKRIIFKIQNYLTNAIVFILYTIEEFWNVSEQIILLPN